MRIWLFFLLLFALLVCDSREVYRSVSEDGVVIYSDTYQPGAERVKVRKSVGNIPDEQEINEVDTDSATRDASDSDQYQTFVIEQPENDETIRNDEGNITVGLVLSPSLLEGHVIHIYLDGKKLNSDMTATQFSLTSLNRGTHQLQARIVDSEGQALIATDAINFHLRKAGIDQP